MSEPRIATSCSGRFHIFDQARELARQGQLAHLFTDAPPSYPARFGVPVPKVSPLWTAAVLTQGWRVLMGRTPVGGWLSEAQRDVGARLSHRWFANRLANTIDATQRRYRQKGGDGAFCDGLIGLSAFTLPAIQVCRDLGVPIAVDHGSLHQREASRVISEERRRWGLPDERPLAADWLMEMEDQEFSQADYVFALSSAAGESLEKQGIPREKIFVNPCGVDLQAFTPAPQPRPADAPFRVVQVGLMTLHKGILDVLEAFARARIAESELWLVGGGRETSGLEALFAKLSSPNVHFIPPMPQADLCGVYRQASVAVLASLGDGFGMVVPQAMACGLPVIVTDHVGAKDLIRDGENGFIIPIRSPDILADRLRLLASNPDLCAAMGAAARKTVHQGYDWQAYGARLAQFWRNRRLAGA